MSDEPFSEPDREAELLRWREATAAESAGTIPDPERAVAGTPAGSRPVWIEQAGTAGVEGWTVRDEAGNPVWIEGAGNGSRPATR